jgi:hypothetical protein
MKTPNGLVKMRSVQGGLAKYFVRIEIVARFTKSQGGRPVSYCKTGKENCTNFPYEGQMRNICPSGENKWRRSNFSCFNLTKPVTYDKLI